VKYSTQHSNTNAPLEQPEECVIEINNLKKSFDERVVLNNISLNLYRGENLVVLGRSGTGKSVLIKCIVGLMQPDSGDIWVLGKNTPKLNKNELNEIRRKIGFSFQGSALYDSMTVKENLEFPLKRNLEIFDQDELDDRVIKALQDVGLERALHQYPSELSGGMQKRIGIARTLILKPEIMLYDEPTSGLDPVTSEEINNLILEVQEKYNTSSIIITHDITCAKTTSNRILFLMEGENKFTGTFSELINTQNQQLRTFLAYFNIIHNGKER
jgi:phospholipid/cholesterol/gamma-HCH transport system ATP-binding protein